MCPSEGGEGEWGGRQSGGMEEEVNKMYCSS